MKNYTIFYAVKNNDWEIYSDLLSAKRTKPDFIIETQSLDRVITKFPERTVESEHFSIKYFTSEGKEMLFHRNKWRVLDFHDPIRYGLVLCVKISDPTGAVRIFDSDGSLAHYQNIFFNKIDSLIDFPEFFMALSELDSWKTLDMFMYENKKVKSMPDYFDRKRYSPGKLNKYYRKL